MTVQRHHSLRNFLLVGHWRIVSLVLLLRKPRLSSCIATARVDLDWNGPAMRRWRRCFRPWGSVFIAIDRPGHGFSDPQPEGRELLDWPREDVTQLLDHLNVDQFYVEGWSAGGSYAIAVAHEFGKQQQNSKRHFLGGAILSGLGPYDRPNPLEGLTNPQIKMWYEWARDQNETAVTAFREQLVPVLQSLNASEIGNLLAQGGGTGLDDLEVAERPDLQLLMGANIKEGYRQGAAGPVQDDLVINRPWGFNLQDISSDVHIDVWQGEVDINVPLNQGIYQDSILPNSTLHILNNTAHLFPLVRWEEILTKLITSSTVYVGGSKEPTVQPKPSATSEVDENSRGFSLARRLGLYLALALFSVLVLF